MKVLGLIVIDAIDLLSHELILMTVNQCIDLALCRLSWLVAVLLRHSSLLRCKIYWKEAKLMCIEHICMFWGLQSCRHGTWNSTKTHLLVETVLFRVSKTETTKRIYDLRNKSADSKGKKRSRKTRICFNPQNKRFNKLNTDEHVSTRFFSSL